MSNLNDRQFSNFTTEREDLGWQRSIRALSQGGREIGYISWDPRSGEDSREGNPFVTGVGVQPRYRRKGIASHLWGQALEAQPDLQHSRTLTEEGRAFALANPRPEHLFTPQAFGGYRKNMHYPSEEARGRRYADGDDDRQPRPLNNVPLPGMEEKT